MKNEILVINTPTVKAKAVYHGEKSVEILAGTSMKPYGQQKMKNMWNLYLKLLDSGVIKEKDNNQAVFAKNYVFSDLNAAAQFLMHRGGDNAGAWKKKNENRPEKKTSGKREKDSNGHNSGRKDEESRTHKPAEKARRKTAPMHQQNRNQKQNTSGHRKYKRRETMADKMHMTPQKGASSRKKGSYSSTGLLTDLYNFRH